MVSEDIHTLDFSFFGTCFGCDLSNGTVVVETSETGDVLLFDVRSKVAEHSCVRVGRVCHDNTFHIRASHLQSLGLFNKNELVLMHKILSFHSWLPGETSNEDDDIGILELFLRFITKCHLNELIFTDLRSG